MDAFYGVAESHVQSGTDLESVVCCMLSLGTVVRQRADEERREHFEEL